MVNGRVYDSTPFVFNEEYPADVHFGEVLKEAGLNYHGYERMYSGISGEELEGILNSLWSFICILHLQLKIVNFHSARYSLKLVKPEPAFYSTTKIKIIIWFEIGGEISIIDDWLWLS